MKFKLTWMGVIFQIVRFEKLKADLTTLLSLCEKADNDIQSIVETMSGNVRVVRLREEPAKRRSPLAWIPPLLRWGLGRQVSERFIFLFTFRFDRFDHLQALRRLDPPVEAVDEVRKDVEFSVHRHRGSL